tara:strand:+ start:39 stop:929 length:891 start_codon:yes stop_codon:yes gene_type:complete
MVNSIGPAFKKIGIIAKKMWADLKKWINKKFIQPIKDKLQEMKDWWAGFKEDVIIKWGEIKEYINTKFIDPLKTKLQQIKDWWAGFKESVIEKWTAIKNYINDNFIGPLKGKIDRLKGKITRMWNFFKGKLTGLWDSLPSVPEFFSIAYWKGLATDIGTTMGGIGDSLLAGIKSGINGMISLFNDLFTSMNFSVDIPAILGGGSVGMDLSSWQIPKLAEGGIVNSPTLAIIGEAGPEAVVPLSGNNAGMGGTYNITVNAGGITDRTDKRELAREIGNMIQQELSRNTGGTTMRGRY